MLTADRIKDAHKRMAPARLKTKFSTLAKFFEGRSNAKLMGDQVSSIMKRSNTKIVRGSSDEHKKLLDVTNMLHDEMVASITKEAQEIMKQVGTIIDYQGLTFDHMNTGATNPNNPAMVVLPRTILPLLLDHKRLVSQLVQG